MAKVQCQAEVHFDNILKPIYWFAALKRYGSFLSTFSLVFGSNSPSVIPLGIILVFLVGLAGFLRIGSLAWATLQTGRCRHLVRESTQGVEEVEAAFSGSS